MDCTFRNLFDSLVSGTKGLSVEMLADNGYSQEKINKFLNGENYRDMFTKFAINEIEQMVNENIRNIEQLSEIYEKEKNDNRNFVMNTYGNACSAFSLYIQTSSDMTDEYCLSISDNIDSGCAAQRDLVVLLSVMKHLNGKALLCANEILCLLENGYPSGAVARWRTLYELWILGEYIISNGAPMAIAFANHKAGDKDYSWASSEKLKPKQGKPYAFWLIESYVHKLLTVSIKQDTGINNQYSEWRKEYELSNKLVHATPEGIFGYWDVRQKSEIINIGNTNISLLKPALNTIGCLYNINKLMFDIVRTDFGIFCYALLKKLSQKVNDEFVESDKFAPVILE